MFGTLFLFLSKWPRELGMTCSLHDIKCIMFKTKILVDLPQMVAIGLKKKKNFQVVRQAFVPQVLIHLLPK